ncbi:winged helix-turn-helix transcriptional regulator [Pikeienuella piscinae]|uniref:Winged helix-turn-helix transcriptional regulator n=1 Tax=Pikeienuella piscinae TaxID=2748098 RepID=A0A7L5C2H3_9RHOB|nr:MarR family winged helix-turn-helix transcriptional regulator [Pikeienuella piscinae]QIE56069.1 winged helix-turn-helix transcriptional regulator [Pikeienuella piscinae]
MSEKKFKPRRSTPPGVDLDMLEHLLSFYLRAVNYGLSRDLDRRMDGLEVAQGTGKITALLLIDSHPGLRPSAIAAATLRDRPSISRIIAPLVDSGLVEKRIAPHERRASELFITPRGHKVAERVRRIAKDQSETFFSVLPEQDRDQLMRILRDLYLKMRVEQ